MCLSWQAPVAVTSACVIGALSSSAQDMWEPSGQMGGPGVQAVSPVAWPGWQFRAHGPGCALGWPGRPGAS
jgi:hypothetical protein